MKTMPTLPDRVRELVSEFAGQSKDLDRLLSEADIRRMIITAASLPKAPNSNATIVDIAGNALWLPIYTQLLGYAKVIIVGRFYPALGDSALQRYPVEFALADAESELYPLADKSAHTVVCLEVLEHLAGDPMHFVCEGNRILVDGGHLCLTTPNVLWRHNLLRFAFGGHPFGWSVFTNGYADRHNREYTPLEIRWLLEAGGFSVQSLTTNDYADEPGLARRCAATLACVPAALAARVPFSMRNQMTLATAKKAGPVKTRYPEFLYNLYGADGVSMPALSHTAKADAELSQKSAE
jgi:SAM-dependent methyltransferase